MAHIRKLGERRYQARWVDPDGRECSKIFSRRTDAEDKIKEVEHSKLDGSYIDHKNPITVAQYAKQWSTTRPHRSTTATRVKSMIDNHIAGTRLGGRRLSAVRTSEVQAWVTERSQTLSPGTVRLVVQTLRSIFNAAVQDRLLARNPVTRLSMPRSEAKDHPVVRNRGSRPGRRHAGSLPSHGHHPSGPRSASRRVTGAPRTGCRLSLAYGAGRIPDNPDGSTEYRPRHQDHDARCRYRKWSARHSRRTSLSFRRPRTAHSSPRPTETCTGKSITARGSLLHL